MSLFSFEIADLRIEPDQELAGNRNRHGTERGKCGINPLKLFRNERVTPPPVKRMVEPIEEIDDPEGNGKDESELKGAPEESVEARSLFGGIEYTPQKSHQRPEAVEEKPGCFGENRKRQSQTDPDGPAPAGPGEPTPERVTGGNAERRRRDIIGDKGTVPQNEGVETPEEKGDPARPGRGVKAAGPDETENAADKADRDARPARQARQKDRPFAVQFDELASDRVFRSGARPVDEFRPVGFTAGDHDRSGSNHANQRGIDPVQLVAAQFPMTDSRRQKRRFKIGRRHFDRRVRQKRGVGSQQEDEPKKFLLKESVFIWIWH